MIHITNKDVQVVMIETERLLAEGQKLRSREQKLHDELVDDFYGVLIGKDINEGRDLLIDFLEEVE